MIDISDCRLHVTWVNIEWTQAEERKVNERAWLMGNQYDYLRHRFWNMFCSIFIIVTKCKCTIIKVSLKEYLFILY